MSSLDEIISGMYPKEIGEDCELSPGEAKAQIKAWVAEEIIGADVPHADSHVFTCDTLKDDFGKYANKCNCGKAEKLLLIAEQLKGLKES